MDFEIALAIVGIKRNQVYQNFVVCLRKQIDGVYWVHYFGSGDIHRGTSTECSRSIDKVNRQTDRQTLEMYNSHVTGWMQENDQHPASSIQHPASGNSSLAVARSRPVDTLHTIG